MMKGKWRSGRGKGGAALMLAALALLAGCRQPGGGEVRALVIGEGTPRLADPASGRLGAADLVLVENVAQGLVRFDPAGNIAPGLAERWAVSDDGLSYVFRLRSAYWPDGRRVRARDVARIIERQIGRSSRNPLRDTLGAVRGVVAMTDRVLALELSAPRPHLLQLLAQPEFGLVREGGGTGPFQLERKEGELLLTRSLPGSDEEEAAQEERVRLAARPAEAAISEFVAGRAALVLGGTSGDLALALGARLPRGALRVDPVAGLFGLQPLRADGPAGDRNLRALLDAAIDRQALVAALGVPQLQPRTSLIQPGLEGLSFLPAEPEWASIPLAERRAALIARARELAAGPAGPRTAEEEGESGPEPVTLRVLLPAGPGGAIILRRLQQDWEPLGFAVEAEEREGRADFRWVDQVAPSSSPAWFLRSFRCEVAPVCLADADRLLEAARLTGFAPQRSAFFAEAERQMRAEVLFIPVAAPIRWSLVARGIDGFAENRFARHTLLGLRAAQDTRN
jgi:oligopeptide transport system substrate-binding protein